MIDQIFWQQLKRSKKTILYLLLLMIVVAFFVTSVNLYRNSTENLTKAEENYSTLAVVEFYGDVDRYGNLTGKNSDDHIGYRPVAVTGYDFSGLMGSQSVTAWDLRTQYAAYVENTPAMDFSGVPRTVGEMIRFKIKGKEPITLNLDFGKPFDIKLDVIDSAAGCFKYTDEFSYLPRVLSEEEMNAYADQIQKVNRSNNTNTIILYPDTEYVACILLTGGWIWSDEPGILEPQFDQTQKPPKQMDINFELTPSWCDNENYRVVYDQDKEQLEYDDSIKMSAPFYIQRWEDVQNDPELKSYYEEAWKDIRILHCVHNVQLTNDFTSIPAYHIGGAHLSEGRLITQEEYESGANVCLVSAELARYQNWKIGDKLKMHIYETYYQPEDRESFNQPDYDSDRDEFIHDTEYEIIGFYDDNPTTGNSGISANTLDMAIHNIYIPKNSVPTRKADSELLLHGSLFSMKLKNGSIDQFLSDMEAKCITTEKEGQYNPKFTFYDQGYSMVQPGLQTMNTTAKLLLALSIILLLITCVLLAYFFWQNQKQTVGIFRLLGGTKKNAVTSVLLCALILCMIGAGIGGAIGYGMAEVVGNKIMEENFKENENDVLLQAYVLDSADKENIVEVKADPLLTVGACGAVLLFPAVMLLFLGQDINKEPRELLPKAKL